MFEALRPSNLQALLKVLKLAELSCSRPIDPSMQDLELLRRLAETGLYCATSALVEIGVRIYQPSLCTNQPVALSLY